MTLVLGGGRWAWLRAVPSFRRWRVQTDARLVRRAGEGWPASDCCQTHVVDGFRGNGRAEGGGSLKNRFL